MNIYNVEYKNYKFDEFPYYGELSNVLADKCSRFDGKKKKTELYPKLFIGADFETSKSRVNEKDSKGKWIPVENFIVSWSISFRTCYDDNELRTVGLDKNRNLFSLYGSTGSEFVTCINRIMKGFHGSDRYRKFKYITVYFHNLGYDYEFAHGYFMDNKYQIEADGTIFASPHKPYRITYKNGFRLQDSLCLASKGLREWTEDLNVEHKKLDSFDYSKIRRQNEDLTDEEFAYQINDTLGLVECLEAYYKELKKQSLVTGVHDMILTATGIPRRVLQQYTKKHYDEVKPFMQLTSLPMNDYIKYNSIYHGGYTHANRNFRNELLTCEKINNKMDLNIDKMYCFDFNSSYPYTMCCEPMFPQSEFKPVESVTENEIIDAFGKKMYLFKVNLKNPKVKDPLHTEFVVLSKAQCLNFDNSISYNYRNSDNGRIVKYLGMYSAYMTNIQYKIVAETYDYESVSFEEILCCDNIDYIPKWAREIYFQFYHDKCNKSGIEKKLAKVKLNSCYGDTAKACIQDDIRLSYDGAYYITKGFSDNPNIVTKTLQAQTKEFDKYLQSTSRPFSWIYAVVITEMAQYRLYLLYKEITSKNGYFIYGDTDSLFCFGVDESAVDDYNKRIKQACIDSGLPFPITVTKDGETQEYWLGVASVDKVFQKFIVFNAKRYAYVDMNGNLNMTVAGVPKINKINNTTAKDWFDNNIENIKLNTVIDGKITGKNTHAIFCKSYTVPHDIDCIDEYGNHFTANTCGSVDLIPCDYSFNPCEEWSEIVDFIKSKKNDIDYENSLEHTFSNLELYM